MRQKKEKFFDMSEGNQERDYSHVSEIVSKIAKLSYLNNDNGIVNLCSGADKDKKFSTTVDK